MVPRKLASLVIHKGCDAAHAFASIRIPSGKGLHKRVLHVVQLVMRTKGNVVVAQIPREIVFQHPDILFKSIQPRRIFGTDVDVFVSCCFNFGYRIVCANLAHSHIGRTVRDVAAVAHHGQSHAQLVVKRTAEVRVKFGHKRVHVVYALIATVYEVIRVVARADFVFIRVVKLIAQRELVVVVDVPVDAAHERECARSDVGTAIIFPYSRYRFVSVGYGLGHVQGHEIAWGTGVVRSRVSVFLILGTCKEEKFVFHDGTAKGSTKSLGRLVLVFLFHPCVLVPSSIEVLIGVVGVGRGFKFVRSRLGNGVDGTASKTALADVERRGHHLYLLNGV